MTRRIFVVAVLLVCGLTSVHAQQRMAVVNVATGAVVNVIVAPVDATYPSATEILVPVPANQGADTSYLYDPTEGFLSPRRLRFFTRNGGGLIVRLGVLQMRANARDDVDAYVQKMIALSPGAPQAWLTILNARAAQVKIDISNMTALQLIAFSVEDQQWPNVYGR